MNIKLNARLCAYSKTSSLPNIPSPSEDNAGDVLGVGDSGSYEFFEKISQNKIDSLFNDPSFPEDCDYDTITNEQIDNLFNGNPIPPQPDTDCNENTITHAQIDSLFK